MRSPTSDNHRDVELPAAPDRPIEQPGRKLIAVAGINDYAAWPRLHNGVNDARGAIELFTRLGFELAAAPLFDRGATGEALRRLVTDDLARLGPEDSLVLFFAGHGFTRTHHLSNAVIKTGYIIPADGDAPTGSASTWVRLDSWLSDVARLRAKHILVILDACYSGVALDAVVTWRGIDGGQIDAEPLSQLRARQSRRVITSALENQRALDTGPVPDHSLFTGCLIEALTGGLARDGKREVTGSELGQYVQRRVTTYPGSRQTPDYGALELDDRGEIVLPVVADPRRLAVPPRPARPARRGQIIAAYAGGLAVLGASILWRAFGGSGPAPVADAPPAQADAPPAQADAPITPADAPPPDATPEAPVDAARAPADAPPRRPGKSARCWVPRDDVHATPRPCPAACAAGCINARSDDAPVGVPSSAFDHCTEVWICEQAPASR